MKFDVLHNFISPVTGRVLADFNYVLVGNRQGIATPSPILIDIRLDLINLRKRYNTLVETDFIVGHPNDQIPNAQVLVNLANGFLYNTGGIVSTLPTTPQIPLCYAATTEDLSATYNNGDSGIGATLSAIFPSEFMIDDQTPPLNSIILVKDQTSSYENGIYTVTNTGSVITPWILTRLGTYDQPMEIQAGDIVAVEYGTVNAQTLWVETQIVNTIGTDPILFILMSLFNTLPEDNIWIGNDMNKPIPHPTIALNNLPDLTFEYIWRGDSGSRPVAVNDLTILEGKVSIIEDDIVVIEGEIATLEAQVAALEIQVALNTADILLINEALVILGATVAGLVATVAINTANIIILFNRTLNEVPFATGDVNINNHKLINVSDPINPLDAVNLETLESYVSGLDVELVDFVIGGPAVSGIITTSRGPTCTLDVIPAAADVSFGNFAIINLETLSFSSWTDMETKAQNGLNFLFLWQFFGGGVS